MTFFFTIIFVLLVFWRPQDWLTPWLWGWNILDGVFGAAVLSLLLEIDSGTIRFAPKYLVWVLFGLYFATVFSHVPHTYFGGVLLTWQETLKMCMFTLLLLCTLDRSQRLRTLMIVFVLMSSVMTVHALLQHERGYGFGGQRPIILQTREGVQIRSLFFGIFEDPNDLAQMILLTVPLVFAIPRRLNFFTFLASSGVAYFLIKGVVATGSRGGVIGLSAMVATLIGLKLKLKWLPYYLLFCVVMALVLCPFAGAALDSSAQNRVIYWGMANRVFKQNLFFGIGWGMFWQIAQGNPAHNAFVHCYTEIGTFGFAFWFGLIVLGILGCWRARLALRPFIQKSDEGKYLYRVAGLSLVSMMGFCAAAYFLSRAFVYPFFFMIAHLNAITIVVERMIPMNQRPLLKRGWRMVALLGFGAIGSVIYIYISIILLNKAF
tara:strand:- start:1515 stop:2813 length:1299 start_codon:yes stop_codon:yes gene_type:complete